jgi:predicted transcriptional regulator
MNRNPITVSPDLSIQGFVDDYLFQYQHKMFPVVDQGRLIGCVKMADLKQVPKSEWGRRKVGELTGTCPSTAIIQPGADARQALLAMQQNESHCLLVTEGDRLLGVVGLRDMLRKLAFKMELENQEPMAA